MKIILLCNTSSGFQWERGLERCGAEVLTRMPDGDAPSHVLLVPEPTTAERRVRDLRKRWPSTALLVLIDTDLALRVRLLEQGADDLMPPSSAPEEIIARLNALTALGEELEPWAAIGGLTIGPSRVAVYLDKRHLDLGQQAYRVLRRLAEASPNSASREALMEAGWGETIDDNRLDALISRLRRALAQTTSPRIETVRGLGYRLLA
jgi:DNA-binding response OmpR family regulator